MFATDADEPVRRRKYSEFELLELEDGRWHASQPSVAVVGIGDSMPAAVADYCDQLLDARADTR